MTDVDYLLQLVTKLVETLSSILKKGKIELSLPHPLKPPAENNKHPNFECKGGGGGWTVLFSEVTPSEDLSQEWFPLKGSNQRKIPLNFVYKVDLCRPSCVKVN